MIPEKTKSRTLRTEVWLTGVSTIASVFAIVTAFLTWNIPQWNEKTSQRIPPTATANTRIQENASIVRPYTGERVSKVLTLEVRVSNIVPGNALWVLAQPALTNRYFVITSIPYSVGDGAFSVKIDLSQLENGKSNILIVSVDPEGNHTLWEDRGEYVDDSFPKESFLDVVTVEKVEV